MSHIFISYNQEDSDFAALMRMTIEKAGFDVWIDTGCLRPGADWSEEIDSGILNASAMVLVVSPDSRASEYVTYEWSFALGASVPVVPVFLRDTEIHPRLQRLQYLDFRDQLRPWKDLVDELNSIQTKQAAHWVPPRDTPPHLQRIINDLESGNAANRCGAIDVLAESEHPIARVALRHGLKYPFRDVRALSAIRLWELSDEEILSDVGLAALIDALGCPILGYEDDTRLRAYNYLLEIGRPAYEVLALTSKSEQDPARLAALDLLGNVGGEDAIPLLIDHLRDENQLVAQSAMNQLGVLDTGASEIAQRLLDPPPENYESHAGWGWYTDITRTLMRINDESIEPILIEGTRHPNPLVRMCAIQILGKICGTAVVPVLADLLEDCASNHCMWVEEDGSAWGETLTVQEVAAMALERIATEDALNRVYEYRQEHPKKNRNRGGFIR